MILWDPFQWTWQAHDQGRLHTSCALLNLFRQRYIRYRFHFGPEMLPQPLPSQRGFVGRGVSKCFRSTSRVRLMPMLHPGKLRTASRKKDVVFTKLLAPTNIRQLYIYIYIYMSSGQNNLLKLMPCTNEGPPRSVVRISVLPEVSPMGYRYRA